MKNPWEMGENGGYTPPVKIFGNLYFVGTVPASTHIIDTGDGLIMLDSGYKETLSRVIKNMNDVGFKLQDLKYIVHTHGHIDHCGATAELVKLTGAKTFIGQKDKNYINGVKNLTYATEYNMEFSPFEADVLLNDGDEITLGNTTIKCVATPGHTEGCMSYFFDVTDGVDTYRAGLHGGMGINTMSREYLTKYGLDFALREQFLDAMERLKEEKVDIFLGNHLGHNNTQEKTKLVLGGNDKAFVDKNEWIPHLDFCRQNLLKMMESENEND